MLRLYDPRLPERFWSKVMTEPNSGCWLWLGHVDNKGYGKYKHHGKAERAHRLTRRFRKTADHKCQNTSCVNPDHLQDVSRAQNSRLQARRKKAL